MKHSILTLIAIVSFFVSSIFCPSAFSQSYQDDFDVLKEKNWEHWGKYAIWRVEDGNCTFKITGPGLPVSRQTKLATIWGQFKQLR